jgi:succinate dehydrogenase/fumarate reductase flavoprotein subunit
VFASSGVWGGSGDSTEAHAADIVVGGRHVGDRRLIAAMTRAIRRQVDDLQAFGVRFRERDGVLQIGRAPGHSYPRHISVEENRGINITRPMRTHAESIGVRFLEGVTVSRLLPAGERVAGVLGIDGKGNVAVVEAGATVLATGGGGRVFLRTNNAVGSTGDGYALAYEAGATLRDMEFVQFYPTALGEEGRRMCFYEAFLPAGAIIRNALGEDVLARREMTDPAAVTRDVLTRVIMEEISDGRGLHGSSLRGRGVDGRLLFDLSTIPPERAGARQQRRLLSRAEGRMLAQDEGPDRIPVAPTVHFFMGGVRIDEQGRTGLAGLYAAGEVCGGIHGANRLGGNALAETFAFGAIAGEGAASEAASRTRLSIPPETVTAETARLEGLASGSLPADLGELEMDLRRAMWHGVGPIRDEAGLGEALQDIEGLRERLQKAALTEGRQLARAVKLSAMLTVGEMVCRAALTRTESRGAHFRADQPEEDPAWIRTVEITRAGDGIALATVPVTGED